MWLNSYSLRITRDLLVINSMTLSVLSLIMLFIGVVREAIRQGLPFKACLEILPYALPNAIVFALPAATLYSTCVVYGRLASDLEILVLESIGVNSKILLRPAMIVALLASLLTVYTVDIAFVWGHHGIVRTILRAVDEMAYSTLKRNGSFVYKDFSISALGVDGDRILNPDITFSTGDGSVNITAEEAKIVSTEIGSGILVTLYSGTISDSRGNHFYFPGKQQYEFSLLDKDEQSLLDANPSHIPLSLMQTALNESSNHLSSTRTATAAQLGFDIISSRFTAAQSASRLDLVGRVEAEQRRLLRLQAEPFRRWASGFSCLAFALLGAPISLRLKHADSATVFGLCFLPILVIYYPLFALGLTLAKNGSIPPYGSWLGNGVLMLLGYVAIGSKFHR